MGHFDPTRVLSTNIQCWVSFKQPTEAQDDAVCKAQGKPANCSAGMAE